MLRKAERIVLIWTVASGARVVAPSDASSLPDCSKRPESIKDRPNSGWLSVSDRLLLPI